MFLEQALKQTADLSKPLRVLDLCAAPGGKSTLLAGMLADTSLLVCNEVIRPRASVLAENLIKWGYPNAVVTNNDPSAFARLPAFFDVIVVDAPCSGEGLFRKEPGAMSEWSPENVLLCSRRQQRILDDVWPALKQGGTLIYSTCTYNPHENEDNLLSFAARHPVEFARLKTNPEWNIEEIQCDAVIGYRFMPQRVNGEGFFLSAFRKLEPASPVQPKRLAKQRVSGKHVETLRSWLINPDEFVFSEHGGDIRAMQAGQFDAAEHVAGTLHTLMAGTSMATPKHDKLIPHHALALSTVINTGAFVSTDLSQEEALKFLRKDTLVVDGLPKGFALATYLETPLGWINVLPNRINNLYPPTWRVRMEGR